MSADPSSASRGSSGVLKMISRLSFSPELQNATAQTHSHLLGAADNLWIRYEA